MIRIYMDWGAVSTLKTDHVAVFDFIKKNKERFLFPHTPAHFNDLIKSDHPENKYFADDLNNLNYLCENHHMFWQDDDLRLDKNTPVEYYKSIKKSNVIDAFSIFEDYFDGNIEEGSIASSLIKSIIQITGSYTDEKLDNKESRLVLQIMYPNIMMNGSSADIVEKIFMYSRKFQRDRDIYKEYRNRFQQEGVKLTTDSGQWEIVNVIPNIDKHLKTHDPNLTFKSLVETVLNVLQKKIITYYDLFVNSYMILDLLGYKQDKLPKKSNSIKNIYNDAEHAFYGAYCDYFVSNDQNLRIKAAVLYHQFQIPTKILSSKEFVDCIGTTFHHHKPGESFVDNAVAMLKKENIKNLQPKINPLYPDAERVEYSLPEFYFDFFDTVVSYSYPKDHKVFFEFQKSKELSYRSYYESELRKLVEKVYSNFTVENISLTKEHKNAFINDSESIIYEWEHPKGYVQLKREAPAFEPILVFYIDENENPKTN